MTGMRLTQTFISKTSTHPTSNVEAVRFIGYYANLHRILEWLSRSNYPFLIGNALEPDTLRHPDGAKPIRGHYIDPDSGVLVLRNPEGDTPAPRGSWLVKNYWQEIHTESHEDFYARYTSLHKPPRLRLRTGPAQDFSKI